MSKKIGITSIGLHFPPLYLTLDKLAELRNVDPDKYRVGLGGSKMALCPQDYTVVELACEAAERCLSRWEGDKDQIGLIAVGTESAFDMSRPLSAYIAEKLNLRGALRSYEVKHACYGGTLALRQAAEWKFSGNGQAKIALVIAVDIALYESKNPGEPTQGAGAVAMLIDEPRIAIIDQQSFPYSNPAFDFWHPLDKVYPLVDGPFSLECYKNAARECFGALVKERDFQSVMNEFAACCFHTPFPKMVQKAFYSICQSYGLDAATTENLYKTKVEPTLDWNKQCGNAYTASLWIAVAKILCGMQKDKRIIAFSYGSGYGAELLTLAAGPDALAGAWVKDVEKDFTQRNELSIEAYESLRKKI